MTLARPTRFAFVLVVVSLTLMTAAWALNFPVLSGRVVDEANIIDQATRSALTEKLKALEDKTTTQLVVVTLKSLQGTSIADYGYQLGRYWHIGQKGTNNGALLIVVPSERKVRIEVGYGLEGTLTDALTKVIIENAIIPRFRANDFAGGIARGVDDLIQVLSGDSEAFKQQVAAKRKQPTDNGFALVFVLIWIGLAVFIVLTIARAQRRGRGSGGIPWFVPIPMGSSSSGSSWSSGSSGGFSDSGGFSGGGGDFGGGGSSGSW